MHDDSASFWADIKEYEERLARDPDSFLFARLAEIYLKVGLADDALHIARQGVTRHPAYVAGLRALAQASHAKGLKDECRAALERVTLAMPEDGEAQRMLGRILSDQGDAVAAGRAFRTALAFNPDDTESRVELDALERSLAQSLPEAEETGVALGSQAPVGDHLDADFGAFEDETAEEIEEIIEDVEILDMDEADLLEEEEAEESVVAPFAPAAAGMVGYDPLSTVTLAELYVQQGFTDKALEIYRTILVNDPGNSEAQSRIAMLEGMAAPPGGLAAAAEIPAPAGEEPAPVAASGVVTAGRGEALAVLDGWLGNIRRLKECR